MLHVLDVASYTCPNWECPRFFLGNPGVEHKKSEVGGHMRTLERVSGSRSPMRPPPTSTPDARRIGTALVMPTSEPKIRLPNTAASLHMALQNPKPVPLWEKGNMGNTQTWGVDIISLTGSFNNVTRPHWLFQPFPTQQTCWPIHLMQGLPIVPNGWHPANQKYSESRCCCAGGMPFCISWATFFCLHHWSSCFWYTIVIKLVMQVYQ